MVRYSFSLLWVYLLPWRRGEGGKESHARRRGERRDSTRLGEEEEREGRRARIAGGQGSRGQKEGEPWVSFGRGASTR